MCARWQSEVVRCPTSSSSSVRPRVLTHSMKSSFSPRSEEVIRPGRVVTVEPGCYLSGTVGIRIEDVVLITRGGCEVLTRSPHELMLPEP